jgi:hypothetical protein
VESSQAVRFWNRDKRKYLKRSAIFCHLLFTISVLMTSGVATGQRKSVETFTNVSASHTTEACGLSSHRSRLIHVTAFSRSYFLFRPGTPLRSHPGNDSNWGHMALESVAAILERTALTTIQDCYELALLNEILMAVPMPREQRRSHLPRLFRDLVSLSHDFRHERPVH